MPAVSSVTCYVVVVLNVLTDLYLLHIPILVRYRFAPKLVPEIDQVITDAMGRPNFEYQEILPDHALQRRCLRHDGRHSSSLLHPDRRPRRRY